MVQCLEYQKGSIRGEDQGNPGPLHGGGDIGNKAWKDETTVGPLKQNPQSTNTHSVMGPDKKESGRN